MSPDARATLETGASPGRALLLWGVLLLVALAGLEGLSRVLLVAAGPYLETKPSLAAQLRTTAEIYTEQSERIESFLEQQGVARELFDPLLGWRYRSEFHSEHDTINEQGLRAVGRYAERPAPGVLRVAAFGDSFVYANGVDDSEAWPAQVEKASAAIEVLNYGVGGYGTDQALLRYRDEGAEFAPSVVLIGFAPVDIRRVVNVYRRFLYSREGILAKPRFVLEERGDLVLLPHPFSKPSDWRRYLDSPEQVRELGAHDGWYEPWVYENPLYDLSAFARLATTAWLRVRTRYFDDDAIYRGDLFNEASEAFRLQVRLLEVFADEVEADGRTARVLVLPNREGIERTRRGETPAFAPLVRQLSERGVPLLDATDAFTAAGAEVPIDDWFQSDGHYSALGNRVVADWLRERLEALREPEPTSPRISARTTSGGR